MKTIKYLFATLLLLCTTVATAHDFEIDDIYYNITCATNKTVEVTYRGDYYSFDNEYTGSVVIPESVTYNGTTYSVTSIGDHTFYNCTGLTSITIPNSVTSIGESAFDDTAWYNNQHNGVVYAGKVLYTYKGTMPANTSITIKDGTLGIAEDAFSGCTGLTSIKIPNSVTSIGYRAFYNCDGLTSITIPNSVTSIGGYAFEDCTGLTSVVIGNSVTSIENDAFSGCTGLTSITIPNSVTSIGERAFEDCTGLTSITIPNNVTSIGDAAFANCNNIFEIEIASKKVITASENIFSSDAYNNACLYVPEGRKFAYEKTAPWKNFHIVEKDFTGNDKMNGKK